MTINGPAPTILAMFMNTAIDQQLDTFRAEQRPRADATTRPQKIAAWVLQNVRGTVQADILKEDQGQNTCIFSTEFSLKVMGDIAEYFVHHKVRNFYSVSISGYHIAEAGANPISQLAFTLSNGFTFVEAYLARGMHDRRLRAEPVVLLLQRHGPGVHGDGPGGAAHLGGGDARPLRRQRAQPEAQVPRADLAAARCTRRRSQFNDIRTTLQALIAIYDNCNSLHTNAYDEAITTPTEDSGAPRDGDPADHQPRVGPGEEREPEPGRVHHRRADRAGRGGGAGRVRADRRARRRARRDGDRLPARQDPGRVACTTRC